MLVKIVIIALEKGRDPSKLHKIESSSPTNAFCQVWLRNWSIGSGKEGFFNVGNLFCYLAIISTWRRACAFLEQMSPNPKIL